MKFNELQFNDFGGTICLLAVRKNWRFYSKTILEKRNGLWQTSSWQDHPDSESTQIEQLSDGLL